ncbi:uncharacterized protein PRCAT00001072001 [Priceomyces carsonii]|uniref:uncharacterized protein n=1 Tax=Priceomyces carsonii TaxID=28549 RepID=UPI002ED920DE|nr:unnamed protein product [Priceomyces carsonii]
MVALTVKVGEAKQGETAPRRKAAQKAAAVDKPLDSKAATLPEFVEECSKRGGNDKAMGWRNLLEVHTEIKKVKKLVDGEEREEDKEWLYYENSSYNFLTYNELWNQVQAYSRGLVSLGLKPDQTSRLHIYASTSAKWMQTFMACLVQGIPIVTAYDTLGESGLVSSLLETESEGIFTDNALLALLIRPLLKAKSIKFIIHAEPIDEKDTRLKGKLYKEANEAREKILKERPDITFITYDECIKLGKENPEVPYPKPKPEDLACIMYTSGSTGAPKGVVISHENIIAAVGGISCNASRSLVKRNDRVIAFLPLAHIFEMAFELANFWWGSCLGYANVKTLTDISCRNCESDLVEFKPTIMVGVAAVWESVRKGVLAEVRKQPALVQKLFWGAYKGKSTFNHFKLPGGGIFDFVFKKVKAKTGGHLRYVLNGGSPISIDAQVFISTTIAPMLVGYGLTETCANTTIVEFQHFEFGTVGTLTGAITAKLVDVPDAGYFAKNNQGEVLLQGKCVTSGYFKNEKETSEAFTEDGWFKTGDIGEWAPNGALKIIDRKKNLVKTLNGEYIALEKLESIYRSNHIVLNICVYADQSKVKPIGIVIPNETFLKQFLAEEKVYSENELSSKSLSSLCEDKKVTRAFLKSLLATGKSQGLKGIEFLQNIVLLDEEWTPQNGFVSSAMKLQRKKILESCKDRVDAAYASS